MKFKLPAIALLAATTLAESALPAERTVTLEVENMTCDLCAPTVKKSLSRVEGLIRVVVSPARKTATVTFDDAKTSEDALTAATRNAGYPSRLAQ
jgi:mercuric ion binding protein